MITLLALVIILVAVAEFFEDKITDVALKEIRHTIDAPLAIEDISFSLLKEFPLATLELKGVWLGREIHADSSAADQTTRIDTLVRIDQTNLSLYLLPLMDGKYQLNEVEVTGAVLNYQVDSAGVSNFDFLMTSPPSEVSDTAVTAFSLLLDHLVMENVQVDYCDNSLKAAATIFIPNINVEGSITEAAIDISSEGLIRLTDCRFDSTNLDLMHLTEVSYKLDYANEMVDIEDLSINTDGALLNVNGQVNLQDTLFTQLNVKGADCRLAELIKYAPSSVLAEAGLKQLAGTVNMTATVNGFVSDSIVPRVDLQFECLDGAVSTLDYPALKNITIRGNMSNGELRNNQSTGLSIEAFQVETEGSRITGAFSVHNLDRLKYNVNTQLDLDINEFQTYVPDSLLNHMQGNMRMSLSTRGEVPDSITDAFINSVLANSDLILNLNQVQLKVDSTLSVNALSGQFKYHSNYISVKGMHVELPAYHLILQNSSLGIGFSGNIRQMESLELKVDSFALKTPESQVKGAAWVRDLTHPDYRINSEIHLNLDEVSQMVPDTLVKKLSGEVKASIHSAGRIHLDSIVDHLTHLVMNQSTINLDVRKVNVEMPDSLMNVRNLSGQVHLWADTIDVKQVTGQYLGIDFEVDSSRIVNVYRAMLKKEPVPLQVEGVYAMGDMDYAMFLPFMSSDSTEIAEDSKPEAAVDSTSAIAADLYSSLTGLGFNFKIKGKLGITRFRYGKAQIDTISCLFNLSPTKFILDQIKLSAFKGTMNSSVSCKMEPAKLIVEFKNKTEGMDIHQLLLDFDDFKQFGNEYISHTQLSGDFSAEVFGYIPFRESLITDSIMMSGDLKLVNGRLKDYAIAVEMGKDYGIDGLDDVQFKTIDTKAFVYKSAVYAPLTNIKTNAFDISFFGMQEFNLDCQYHLRFYLKEILRKGKTNRIEKKQSKDSKQDDYGGTKGLTSLFAIYKVKNGETVKSALEGKNSEERLVMDAHIRLQEFDYGAVFSPKRFKFETGVKAY